MTSRIGSIALLASLAALTLPGVASADRGYTVRFTTNAQGDITGTGNTLMTCRDDDSQCAAAQRGQANGGDNNNNARAMRYVDIDTNPATFDSSAATVALPTGARVLFAGLYYTGRLAAGSGGQAAPSPGDRNKVLFRPPNLGAYVALTANQVDDANDPGTGVAREYQGFVDVTGLVAAAGGGEYTVANVQLGTGFDADQAGGWALAIAYEDATQPTRNLTIFDGFRFVLANGPPVDIPLSGFVTPPSGAVTTRIGLVAIEGDLGTTQDSATINAGTPTAATLANATNPASNFFNASISTRAGTSLTTKRPNYLNQLGFDADIFDASGLLANNQTSTTIRLATGSDGFAPNAVSFATDLFAPSLNVTKAVDKAEAQPGDELTYTVGVTNTGLDAATNTILTDTVPAGTTYVPGSLRVASGANAGAKTDAVADDQGEFRPAGKQVVVRLGDGAGSVDGGRLAIGASTSISFRVRVNDDDASGTQLVNNAGVSYIAETLQQAGATTSPDVVTQVRVPDLAIDKSHTGNFESGRSVPFSLVVSSVGDVATRGRVTVTDTLPDELSFVGAPAGDGWDCATAARTLTCTRDDAIAPGTSYPPIQFVARVAPDTPGGELANTGEVSNASDHNPLNDADTDIGENAPPSIDLAIQKTALTPIVFAGKPATWLIRVVNRGPNTATDVVVRDVFPRGLTAISAQTSQGTCRRVTCNLGTMRRGAVATISVVTLAGPDTGGQRLRNVASVHGHEHEIDESNNSDDAFVSIIKLVDIAVTKTAVTPTVTVGGNAVFLVVVRNNGPSDATGVVFADRPPSLLTPLSATPSQGRCVTPTRCALGSIPAGGAVQILMVARVEPSATAPLVNLAGAVAREPELNLSNNLARATVTPTPAPPPPPANVVVTKEASAQTVNVGDNLSYRITATNRGPGTADSVVVSDTLDPATSLVSATPSQGSCTPSNPVTCTLGALAPGASATVIVVVRVNAAGPLRNAVTAVTPTPVPQPGAAIAVEAARAESGPTVSIRKSASPRVVSGGDSVTFTITATARGNGTARNLTVCDSLPDGFTVRDAGGASRRNGQWCWQIPALRAGRSRTLTIVTAAPGVRTPTTRTNTATLTGGGQAPRTATAGVRIVPAAPPFTG